MKACSILRKPCRTWLAAWTAALWLAAAPLLYAETARVKVALVTPEGSAWTNALRQMAEEVSLKTGGSLRFTIYAGGVSGDEMDVLRKMQVDRIQAAGLSGVGLGVTRVPGRSGPIESAGPAPAAARWCRPGA